MRAISFKDFIEAVSPSGRTLIVQEDNASALATLEASGLFGSTE